MFRNKVNVALSTPSLLLYCWLQWLSPCPSWCDINFAVKSDSVRSFNICLWVARSSQIV